MKLSLSFVAFASATSFKELYTNKVQRNIVGEWVDKNLSGGRHRRQTDASKFTPLAAMIAYMQGEGEESQKPLDQNMDETLQAIEAKYTNYGCYCWRNGVKSLEDFTAGSGNADMIDTACTTLYRCYTCIGMDYGKTYKDLEYTAVFTTDADGNRKIDCTGNAQSDGEHVCQCDAKFAETLEFNRQQCQAGIAHQSGKGYCVDEQYRTSSGGGSYECPKLAPRNIVKEKCCGLYPNRRSYSIDKKCCRMSAFDGEGNPFDVFEIKASGTCSGTVVESEDGNPHNYIAV